MSDSVKNMSRSSRILVTIMAFCLSVIVLGFVLHEYPPERYMYVPCLLHLTTGLHCPGCGSTRAVSSILHGDVALALKNNLLIILWGPYLMYRGTQSVRSWIDQEPKHIWEPPKRSIFAFLILTLVYTVLRNLPIQALNSLLAPIGN